MRGRRRKCHIFTESCLSPNKDRVHGVVTVLGLTCDGCGLPEAMNDEAWHDNSMTTAGHAMAYATSTPHDMCCYRHAFHRSPPYGTAGRGKKFTPNVVAYRSPTFSFDTRGW